MRGHFIRIMLGGAQFLKYLPFKSKTGKHIDYSIFLRVIGVSVVFLLMRAIQLFALIFFA